MMYLLLRDNKQSGPYSLDELKAMGLKAYDLVWVDGKSAAWRYPCEVAELSSFAPPVDEQPFDRFYKKPNTNTTKSVSAAGAGSRPAAEKENTLPASTPSTVYTNEPTPAVGKRTIYVTLPAGKGQGVLRESISREPVRTIPPSSAPASRPLDQHLVAPVDAPDWSTNRSDLSRERIMNGEEKLSHLPDDWKNAVEIAPPHTGRKGSKVFQSLGVVICILALLAAGIFIGLSINNRNLFRFGKKIASTGSLTNNQPVSNQVLQQLPVPVPASTAPATQTTGTAADSSLTQTSAAAKPSASISLSGKLSRQNSARDRLAAGGSRNLGMIPAATKDSVALNNPIVHREAVHRSDIAADTKESVDNDVVKNNISNLVSVGTSGYTVGTFGGISSLQLTVSNHSVYPLDLVVVEVQYIQANKKVFKTENLYFRGIGPGSALMQEAPKSSRGIKVQYKITLVNSKGPGLSYSGI